MDTDADFYPELDRPTEERPYIFVHGEEELLLLELKRMGIVDEDGNVDLTYAIQEGFVQRITAFGKHAWKVRE